MLRTMSSHGDVCCTLSYLTRQCQTLEASPESQVTHYLVTIYRKRRERTSSGDALRARRDVDSVSRYRQRKHGLNLLTSVSNMAVPKRLAHSRGAMSGSAPSSSASSSDASNASAPLREYARRLEILREIDRAILTARKPNAIAEAALRRLRDFVPFIRASVVLFHWDDHTSEILAAYRKDGPTRLSASTTFSLDDIPVPEPLHNGEMVMIGNIDVAPSTPITKQLRQDENIRSYVCCPLLVEETLIGMVNFGADATNVYRGQWQHVIREVSDQLAIAIRQARLVEQVKTYSEELEMRVAERTEELEAFTYSVSHDLRTPLRAVDGFSKMLMERYGDALDGEGQRLIQVIQENTTKMSRLIDGLLALSRVGRQEMHRRPVDVGRLVEEVFQEVCRSSEAPSNTETNARLVVETLPDVRADRSMVRRLLVNVLANAVKFSQHEPDPQVTVRAETSDAGATVYVVEDNGVGFDMAYVDKLFGVFEQLHAESFDGTGIGLAIAARVVRRHGGRIWAEGTVGNGASIFFTLTPEDPGP